MTIVTGCKSPDLDGIACMIAYSELLNAKGTPSAAKYSGRLDLETDFVKNFTNYFPATEGSYPTDSDFVLVDTANPDILDENISIDRVVTVFDHRQMVFTDKFINADLHIERVGSCATLIAEEFQKSQITPSVNTATYLYGAIIFSTINFKNSVTTDRDVKAANWLLSISKVDDSFIPNLFSAKSQVSTSNLYDILLQDFAIQNLSGHLVGIAQIEMININRFEADLKDPLKESLTKLKTENGLDYIFFNGIDLIEGYSFFAAIDSESKALFSSVLNLPKFEDTYRYDKIMMRKEIWPKVENYLKVSSS